MKSYEHSENYKSFQEKPNTIHSSLFSEFQHFEIIGQQWLAKFTVCLQPHGSSSSSRVCTRCVGRVGLSSSCASWDLRTIQFLAWIVKEGRPLPQDEVRMFLASVQSRPRARGGNITTTKHSSPNKKKHIVPSEKQKKNILLPYHITKKK